MSSTSDLSSDSSSTGIIVAAVCGSLGAVFVGILIVYCCYKGKKLDQHNPSLKKRKTTSGGVGNSSVLDSSLDQTSSLSLFLSKSNKTGVSEKKSLTHLNYSRGGRDSSKERNHGIESISDQVHHYSHHSHGNSHRHSPTMRYNKRNITDIQVPNDSITSKSPLK